MTYYHPFYMTDPCDPELLEFSAFNTEELSKISVVPVTSYISFDSLKYPISGGLHDPRLGPLSQFSNPCGTCGNALMKCAGHYGTIELPLPVINPTFANVISNIMRSSCIRCHRVNIAATEKIVLCSQLKLLDAGCIIEAQVLQDLCGLKDGENKSTFEVRHKVDAYCNRVLKSVKRTVRCKATEELRKHIVDKAQKQAFQNRICCHCMCHMRRITLNQGKLFLEAPFVGKRPKSLARHFYMPLTMMEEARNIWKVDGECLAALAPMFASCSIPYPTDVCFTKVVLVTPSNTRPVNVVKDRYIEHAKNSIYKMILSDCMVMRQILSVIEGKTDLPKETTDVVDSYRGKDINEKLHYVLQSTQTSVNCLLDSASVQYSETDFSRIGLKQLIEKKAGIIRQNMMGKRVDYFARSVITPDPMLNIDEIGIPEVFARKLTYPMTVTPWNVSQLRKMVLNGPDIHPGATMIECDNGYVIKITTGNAKSLARTLLTPSLDSNMPKVVHRHLLDGDVLLMNRQPTLHKPSMMAHKARILRGEKTFRLHYANCKAYNADFDGDEMNAHFPQGEMARVEAQELVCVPSQYLVPRDGSPLSGLIQDHVIAGIRLSLRGRFFDRQEYNQLIHNALCFFTRNLILLKPAIMKPKELWSGKQVISTIVINLTPAGKERINLMSESKLKHGAWPGVTSDLMPDTAVVFRSGEMMSGILDKNHMGATHFGLIHSFYELYGCQHSTDLLGAFSKLCTYYLQKDGFTLGVEDILVTRKADKKRDSIGRKVQKAGKGAALKALDLTPEDDVGEEQLKEKLEVAYKRNTNFRARIDREYKTVLDSFTNDVNKACLPAGLLAPFPKNNLQLMVQSGAKGSTVNTMQISCLLGQIELEGKRPPIMVSGRSLPSFRPYDTSPIAGGFILSRFMSGLKPQEFFFHCMAGREGLIDTAVKTSRSGYLQRCLVKHLESLTVNYDMTVRDSDNSIVQFLYGEDGLDITKSQILDGNRMGFLEENVDAVYDKKLLKSVKNERKEIKEEMKKIFDAVDRIGQEVGAGGRKSGFLNFCREMGPELMAAVRFRKKVEKSSRANHCKVKSEELRNLWNSLHPDTKAGYERMTESIPDPVHAVYQPDSHLGSVSERMHKIIEEYAKNRKSVNPSFDKSKFKNAAYLKYFSSLCQPGEAVGVLAAQSVGEPSTQMTLNTFHFAGRGEMNVTLGIPRLREILMVASKNIKTPSMEIPFRTDVPDLKRRAEKIRKSLTRLTLHDVLEKIDVEEKTLVKDANHHMTYAMKLHYLPKSCYEDVTNVSRKKILKYVGREFCNKLLATLKKNVQTNYNSLGEISEGGVLPNDDEMDDNDDEQAEDGAVPMEDAGFSEESEDEIGDGDAVRELKSHVEDDYDEQSAEESCEEGEEFTDERVMADEEEKPKSSVATGKTASIPNYGVKSIEHADDGSWSKIVLFVSSMYKRLDFSMLLPSLVETAVMWEVPGIKRAITYENAADGGRLTLKTEGSYGIWELFKHQGLLDLNKLYSNDVHAIAQMYGIEAANRVIVKEVQDVFKVYGITVDPRHLLLIADYMTWDGTYKGLNRAGMDGCPSPFQQMSFESSLKYLKTAAARNLKDNLRSPSSTIIMGQESKFGAGLVQLLCR